MTQDLRKRMKVQILKIQEMFNKELQDLMHEQTEINNTKIEMKNTLERINSRKNEAEERIRELEDRLVEITATEQINKKEGKEKRTV